MSIGPMNSIASAAGSHLAQTRGSDVDRAAGDSEQANAQGRVNGKAAGDASIEENHETTDRDADGKAIPFGPNPEDEQDDSGDASSNEQTPDEGAPRGKDAHGELGNRLDISG